MLQIIRLNLERVKEQLLHDMIYLSWPWPIEKLKKIKYFNVRGGNKNWRSLFSWHDASSHCLGWKGQTYHRNINEFEWANESPLGKPNSSSLANLWTAILSFIINRIRMVFDRVSSISRIRLVRIIHFLL